METINIPQTTVLHIGKVFKVLRITGNEGTSMPDHFCTHEAVIVVHKGSAILQMSGIEYPIIQNQSFIIPSGQIHSLVLKNDFEANVIMKMDAQIKFFNA